MQKISLAVVALATVLPFSAIAEQKGRFYLGGKLDIVADSRSDAKGDGPGISVADDDITYYPGYGFGAMLGYHVTNDVRVEAEGSYRVNQIRNGFLNGNGGNIIVEGHLDSINTMLNAYYDIDTETMFEPYIGVGAGALFLPDIGGVAFAYQGMAGMNVNFTEQHTVYGGYRYVGSLDAKGAKDGGNNLDLDLRQHIAEAGYRYTF